MAVQKVYFVAVIETLKTAAKYTSGDEVLFFQACISCLKLPCLSFRFKGIFFPLFYFKDFTNSSFVEYLVTGQNQALKNEGIDIKKYKEYSDLIAKLDTLNENQKDLVKTIVTQMTEWKG